MHTSLISIIIEFNKNSYNTGNDKNLNACLPESFN